MSFPFSLMPALEHIKDPYFPFYYFTQQQLQPTTVLVSNCPPPSPDYEHELKNKKNTKEIESSYAEIVKYSLTCLNTLMTSSPSTKEYFVQVLGTLHISKSSLTKCITQIPEALPSFTNSNKIKASIEDFVKNIEKLK